MRPFGLCGTSKSLAFIAVHSATMRDLLREYRRDRGSYFALKVLSQAESTKDNIELGIMAKLDKLQAAFYYHHKGIEKPFLCLVMATHGPSLSGRGAAKINPPADVPSITTFIRTLFSRVVEMHDLGIVHGGTFLPKPFSQPQAFA